MALVGHGHIGAWHAQKILWSPLAHFTAIVETNRDCFAAIKQKYPRVFLTSRLEEAISKAQAFIVATPTSTHFDIVNTLLGHNKHIFVRNPLQKTMPWPLPL